MTLIELLNSARLFLLPKKKVRICSRLSTDFWCSEEFIIGDIPYRLLKKEVVKTICYDGVVEIFVK